jgi:2-keto-4-pentenoate hydratase/2-oxohepta-3-ene-1,7-dioic acid hydratase in catechol pathway
MRLVSFGSPGAEQPGVLDGDGIIALQPLLTSLGLPRCDMNAVIGLLEYLRPRIDELVVGDSSRLAVTETRLGPPVTRPGTIVGVGLNYPTAESAPTPGRSPVPPVFLKPLPALCGPTDEVVDPQVASVFVPEVELAVVIGRRCRRVRADDCHRVIAGYTVANDFTLPELIFSSEQPQMILGKGHDTLVPLGPCLVTREELEPVADLELTLDCNGEARQRGHVGEMLRGIPELIELITGFTTLSPGDVILTGSPMAGGIPRAVAAGDVVTAGIAGIGTLVNPVVEA